MSVRTPSSPSSSKATSETNSLDSFKAGELVEYWSQRHGQWIEATVMKPNYDDYGNLSSYDLDVKSVADARKIRKKSIETGPPRTKDPDAPGLRARITAGLNEGW